MGIDNTNSTLYAKANRPVKLATANTYLLFLVDEQILVYIFGLLYSFLKDK